MAETPYTGLTASIKLGAYPSGECIGYISGFSLELDKEIIEIIAFCGDGYKEKIPSIKDWTASCDGTAAFEGTYPQEQLYAAYEDGTAVTIGCYLDATTYFEGTAYVKSLSIDSAPDDKTNVSIEFEGSGAIIFSIDTSSDYLTFVCTDHVTAGATQVASVSPVATGANTYMYRVNVSLPAVGKDLTGLPWTAYVLEAALPAINGDVIVLAEIDADSVVVKRGQATAVVA